MEINYAYRVVGILELTIKKLKKVYFSNPIVRIKHIFFNIHYFLLLNQIRENNLLETDTKTFEIIKVRIVNIKYFK